MRFGAGLRESLHDRATQVAAEFTCGDDLKCVLERHLATVAAMTDGDLITSIVLLSADGKLSHCATRGLPQSYCEATDGAEIGPSVGSCGTAAYYNRPVYVADIANDPLWADYRDIALSHGLASCWSTPIRATDGEVVGTFAIYHRAPGNPTREEIEAIDMIAEHVARAIVQARDGPVVPKAPSRRPKLRLVSDEGGPSDAGASKAARLVGLARTLELKAAELDRLSLVTDSPELAERLKATAATARTLAASLHRGSGA